MKCNTKDSYYTPYSLTYEKYYEEIYFFKFQKITRAYSHTYSYTVEKLVIKYNIDAEQ